jgi:hypothetical protein
MEAWWHIGFLEEMLRLRFTCIVVISLNSIPRRRQSLIVQLWQLLTLNRPSNRLSVYLFIDPATSACPSMHLEILSYHTAIEQTFIL